VVLSVPAALALAAALGGTASCGSTTIYADASSDAASTCPVSVASLQTPTWKAPTAGTTGACSSGELFGLAKAAADPGKSFTDLYAALTTDACRACVFSAQADDHWQPIVWAPSKASGAAFLNFGACFDVASGGSAACGGAVQDDELCLAAACPATCLDQVTCLNQASLDVCATRGTTVSTACGASSTALFATCDTFMDGVRVVCGPAIVDGGADAGDAGDAGDASPLDAGDAGDADISDAGDAGD
jgi:hypothetical protein